MCTRLCRLLPMSLVCLLACGRQASTPPKALAEPPSAIEPTIPPPASSHDEDSAPTVAATAEPRSFERPTEWPEALPFPSDIDPEKAWIMEAPTGDLVLEYNAGNTDITAIAARWTDALASYGFELQAPCEPQLGACLHASEERLASVSTFSRDEGAWVIIHLLPRHHVPIRKLPGPCVELPSPTREVVVHTSGIDQSGKHRERITNWTIAGHPGHDLDGDGRPEWFVPHQTAGKCPWEIPHDVYVVRGTCGHKVGTVVGQIEPSTRTARFRKGLREIHTTAGWATYGRVSPVPEHHERTRTFTFDGRRLRRTRDDTQSGTCHHCGVARCIDL